MRLEGEKICGNFYFFDSWQNIWSKATRRPDKARLAVGEAK